MGSNPSYYDVKPGKFNNRLSVPASKSYGNRLLILAALCPEPVTLKNIPLSTDVQIMIDCLKKIGLKIIEGENTLLVENSFPACEKEEEPLILETGDGGTTNRFLIPFLARGKRTYHIEPSSRMRIRPMDEQVRALEVLGVRVGNQKAWMEIQGPYRNDIKYIEVESKKSTQFVTGVSLALWDMNVEVKPLNMENSAQYYEMTLDLIKQLRGGKREFQVPVDFSSLSYPLAMGLTLGSVHVENCFEVDSFQADSAFIEIIEEMGGEISFSDEGLKLSSPKGIKPIDRDCSAFPDLVPTLAYVCAYARGNSILRNLGVLRHKESDRVLEIHKCLDAFSVKYSHDQENENLTIYGSETISEAITHDPPDDHRIVMISYLFMRKNGGGKLSHYEHVAKSFANFFEVME